MKKLLFQLFGLVIIPLMLFFSSCKKNVLTISGTKPEIELSDKLIYSSERNKVIRLSKDTVYILKETIVREEGEQLIIEEGTLINVQPTESQGNVGIIIQAGGIIVANGTAEHPVVFTSEAGNGNVTRGWAGIVIHGRSADNDLDTKIKDAKTKSDLSDFSGLLNYVRIENAALRLHAVGNRTMIENVMVSNAFRDETDNFTSAFHIYGGTFNARNLVSYACGGSADFYISGGYQGKMQNLLAYRIVLPRIKLNTSATAWYGVYIENNTLHPATALPLTFPVISNLTVIGPGADSRYAYLYAHPANQYPKSAAMITTGNARFTISNSLLLGFGACGWYMGDSYTVKAVQEGKAIFSHSLTHSNGSDRTIFVQPGCNSGWEQAKFRDCRLSLKTDDGLTKKVADNLLMEDVFDLANKTLILKNNSTLWKGADFRDAYYQDDFFQKTNHIGALGRDNWLAGWTRFNASFDYSPTTE